MKRIISLILSIMMVLSVIFCTPVSATAINYEAAIDAMEVLRALNIADSELDENSFSPEQKVTRAEFAIYLTNFLEKSDEKGDGLYYNDVPKSHYAYDAITILTRDGYLRGVKEKTFSPDESILTEHALSVFLKILGYGSTIKIDEREILRVLNRTGIRDNISSSSELLLGDLYIMMFNTLISCCVDMTGISSDGIIFDEETTYLYYSRKMEYISHSRLTAANGANINGTPIDVDDVIIDGVIYKSDIGDLIDYLGYEVEFIYQQRSSDAEKRIVWIRKCDNERIIKINADEDCEYNPVTGEFRYHSGNDKLRTVRLPANLAVVYNGRFLSDGISEILNHNKYDLTLISSSDNSSYDIAIVWECENLFISSVDTNAETVTDKIGKRVISIAENDYDSLVITNEEGKELTSADVKIKSVISMYRSKDESYMKAIVSSAVVSGNITGKNSKAQIKIDDTWYDFYNEADAEKLGTAKSITAYLAFNGEIVYTTLSYVGGNSFVGYAYLATVVDDVFETKLRFKVLHEDGELKTFETADNVTLDDQTNPKKTVEQIFNDLGKTSDGKFKPQLLCFALNKDNQITKIYRASDNGGTAKVLIKHQEQPTANIYWANCLSPQNRIGRLMAFDDNTKVFYVPNDVDVASAKEKDFSVGSPVYDQKYPGAISYKTTEENIFYEQYIVTKQQRNVTIDNRNVIVLVDDIGECLDDDENVMPMITGMQSGNEVSFVIDEDYIDMDTLGVKSGDIIRVLANGGVVEKIEVLYSYGNTDVSKNAHEVPAEFRYIMGEGHSKEGDIFKLSYYDAYLDDTVTEVVNTINAKSRIMVYDSKSRRDKTYKGSVSDIDTILENGKGSKIFIQNYVDQILGIVIYK